jgi:hypothetical protein
VSPTEALHRVSCTSDRASERAVATVSTQYSSCLLVPRVRCRALQQPSLTRLISERSIPENGTRPHIPLATLAKLDSSGHQPNHNSSCCPHQCNTASNASCGPRRLWLRCGIRTDEMPAWPRAANGGGAIQQTTNVWVCVCDLTRLAFSFGLTDYKKAEEETARLGPQLPRRSHGRTSMLISRTTC